MTAKLLRSLLAFLAALAVPAASAQVTLDDPDWVYEEVVTGLDTPASMEFLPDGTALVIERTTGRVKRANMVTRTAETILDLNVVTNSLERGLVGIAIEPASARGEGAEGGLRVFLYWTEHLNAGDNGFGNAQIFANTLSRFRYRDSAIDAESREDLIYFPYDPGPIHIGGAMRFLPDGTLAGIIGDLERRGLYQNSPDDSTTTRSGMVWRITPDGEAPADNPFYSEDERGGGDPLRFWTNITYAYGIRNGFGLEVGPVKGRLWMTENGPIHWDEINLVTPGWNGGWDEIIGPPGQVPGDMANLYMMPGAEFRAPLFSWFTPIGITQMHFYRGSALGEEYTHQPFFGGFNYGHLYHLRMTESRDGFDLDGPLADGMANNNPERELTVIGSGFGPIVDIDTGADECLYLTIYGASGTGSIARIRPRGLGQWWVLY